MAGLLGIANSNRNDGDFWSKNRFNSSFPAALANYMLVNNIPVNYIVVDKELKTRIKKLSVDKLYNMGKLELNDLYFSFESKYEPYQKYAYEAIDGIDLVIKDTGGNFLRPLEVKLTVLPDNSTCKNENQSSWGSEIVIRSATTQYCSLGMAHSLSKHFKDIRDMFENPCSKIQDWNNKTEIKTSLPKLIKICDDLESKYYKSQKPLIMQPVWKTDGQSPILSKDHTFDIFVWSDFAFSRLFLSQPVDDQLTRPNRTAARFIRFWYEISRNKKVHLNDIYKQMTYDLQTDKEFSVNGISTNEYMRCPRLTKPIINRNALSEIILDGGEKLLMPERRLDQSVLYFTMTHNNTD